MDTKHIITTISMAAALALPMAATANITVDSYNSLTTNNADATTLDFDSPDNNADCRAYTSCSGTYWFPDQDYSGITAAPAGLPSGQRFLSVPDQSGSNGSATFTLPTASSYFGLYWGSIDSYNSISFFSGGTQVGQTYNGSDIASPADGNQQSQDTNFYVDFTFSNGMTYDAVEIASSSYAFESANHAYQAAVPEPGTLALLGLGLAGLGFAGRRRRS